MNEEGLPVPSPDGAEEYYGSPDEYLEPVSTGFTRKLSTISEHTERTDRTPRSGTWPTRQEIMAPRRPPSTPTSTSSYGQVIHPSKSSFLSIRKAATAGRDDARSIGSSSNDYGQVIG